MVSAMKKRWACFIFISLLCLQILVSCVAQKFDITDNSEDKGYIIFVADTENIPDNYLRAPSFNVIFGGPFGEMKKGFFSSVNDVIITAPPGSRSFLIQPFEKGKTFEVPVNVVKDHIVKVKCYIIQLNVESYSTNTWDYGYTKKTKKTTTTTTRTFRFKYEIEPAKPYQL